MIAWEADTAVSLSGRMVRMRRGRSSSEARLNGRQTRQRLHDGIVDRFIRQRSPLSKTGNRYIDNFGSDTANIRFTDTQPLYHPGTEILDKNIRGCRELLEHHLPVRILKVEGDRALAPIDVEERGRQPLSAVTGRAGMVTPARHLDLDDISPLVAQDGSRPRTGEHGCDVDNPVSAEGSRHDTPFWFWVD